MLSALWRRRVEVLTDEALPALLPAWLDTTMALTGFMQEIAPFPQSLLPQLRDLSAQGRVLFGSDFPNIPYSYAHQVQVLLDAGLDMPEVLWRAPAKLFGPGQCSGLV